MNGVLSIVSTGTTNEFWPKYFHEAMGNNLMNNN